MPSIIELFQYHKGKAESIRVNCRQMFFRLMEDPNKEKVKREVLEAYNNIVSFLIEHNQLVSSASTTDVSQIPPHELDAINALPALMYAMIVSFKEIGVNCKPDPVALQRLGP